MAADTPDKEEIHRKLWDQIKERRFGMLGLADDARQFQPMTAFAEPHERVIWFFTKADTDLAKAVVDGAAGAFILQSKDDDLQACITGELEISRDAGRIDKYWNPMVAAWFPDGRDDPNLVLLRLNARRGEVWIAQTGPIRMAWEITKANLTKTEPDLGDRASLDLKSGSGAVR